MGEIMIHHGILVVHILVGGWPTPLKNMKVSWDDYSKYMESHTSNVPNHQPAQNQNNLENPQEDFKMKVEYVVFTNPILPLPPKNQTTTKTTTPLPQKN